MSYALLFLWFELLALIIAVVTSSIKPHPVMKWFIPLLLITNSMEWGNFFYLFMINGSNNWTANLVVDPAEYLFFGWFFYTIIRSPFRKRILVTGTILLLFGIINLLFIQKMRFFNSYTYLMGCAFIVYWVYLYFSYLMQQTDEQKLTRSPYFWVSVGCLFFFIGEFFLFAFYEYFLQTNNFDPFISTYLVFSNLLNIIFYSCLSIALLWTLRQKQY